MSRQDQPKKSPERKARMPATRIISTDLDLKKSGLVVSSPRQQRSGSVIAPSLTEDRQTEVLRRLREQEERRRQHYVEKMRQDEERRRQTEHRRDELKQLIKQRAQEKEAEAKERRLNAIRVSQAKFDSMLDRLKAKEWRRLQYLDEAQAEKDREKDAVCLEAVVKDIDSRKAHGRDAEKAKAAAQRKRKHDAELRQRATQALWDRQQRMLDAIRDRNRAELERLLSVPQPHLEARLPHYNFMEYPANSNMRRLLFEYKRKRIDEVTFNKKAAELARKMSPRRILLHQNQLLRERQALERAAESVEGARLVHVSAAPTAERTRLRWPEPAAPADVARRLAAALADEALQRSGAIYRRLLERSDVDLPALLDEADAGRTFDDDGDLEQSLSAFDFGDELEVDAEAAGRIDAMYRSQACEARSARETRAYPSGELDTFSSAVLDPGVSCSCTTLSGIDSQCSLCQLMVVQNGKTKS